MARIGTAVRRACALLVVVTTTGLALVPEALAEEPPSSANECVTFRSDAGERTQAVAVENGCKRAVTCSLRYAVTCESHDRKVRKRSEHTQRFQLAADQARTVMLSATACKQNHHIEDIEWTCEAR